MHTICRDGPVTAIRGPPHALRLSAHRLCR